MAATLQCSVAAISYGIRSTATVDMRIAILAIGYADGYARSLSNGKGSVWIKGYLAPVIGDVCMDMTMVDNGRHY